MTFLYKSPRRLVTKLKNAVLRKFNGGRYYWEGTAPEKMEDAF